MRLYRLHLLKTKLTTFHSLTPFKLNIIDMEQPMKLQIEARDINQSVKTFLVVGGVLFCNME